MIIRLDMLTEIKEDIEKVIFNHCITEENIINDEGKFNVPLEGHPNVQYTFADMNEYGQRSPEEIKRLLFLNDAMKLIYKMHLYINVRHRHKSKEPGQGYLYSISEKRSRG